jgi:hypothetical protein
MAAAEPAANVPAPAQQQAVVIHPYITANVKTHIPVVLEMKNPQLHQVGFVLQVPVWEIQSSPTHH